MTKFIIYNIYLFTETGLVNPSRVLQTNLGLFLALVVSYELYVTHSTKAQIVGRYVQLIVPNKCLLLAMRIIFNSSLKWRTRNRLNLTSTNLVYIEL